MKRFQDIKYKVDIQYRARNDSRPDDEGMTVDIGSENGAFVPLPNIGDHVVFIRDGGQQIMGVVENRLFMFLTQDYCGVNIVVTDSDTSSGKLIKE